MCRRTVCLWYFLCSSHLTLLKYVQSNSFGLNVNRCVSTGNISFRPESVILTFHLFTPIFIYYTLANITQGIIEIQLIENIFISTSKTGHSIYYALHWCYLRNQWDPVDCKIHFISTSITRQLWEWFTLLQEKNWLLETRSYLSWFTSIGVGLSLHGESSLKLSCWLPILTADCRRRNLPTENTQRDNDFDHQVGMT
jgi:hypothetical protein